MRGECERRGEERYAIPVSAGAEARIEDIVRAGHAFDDVAGKVGVGGVGGDVDGGTSGEGQEVHEAKREGDGCLVTYSLFWKNGGKGVGRLLTGVRRGFRGLVWSIGLGVAEGGRECRMLILGILLIIGLVDAVFL